MITVTTTPIASQRSPAGTDYIVFACACGRRNRQSLYEAEYKTENARAVAFKCKGCGKVCEVSRPLIPASLIVTPEQFASERRSKQARR